MLRRGQLLSVWKLLSHETQKEGFDFEPTGESPWGSLVYLDSGFMSVSINWQSGSYLFYSGSFDFIEESQLLVHRVSNSSQVWRIGKELERHASLDSDGLLQLVGMGAEGRARVLWRRENA